MLGPFDPTTLSAGIVTNFAYDILKNKSLSSRNTLVGRLMRWVGLGTATFEERLRDTLTKTSVLLIKEHPDFANEAVASFLQEPEVARQIGDHILDRLPLDEKQLQQLFQQHVQRAHSASRILLQRKGITEQQIIAAFLHCYRRVLSEQLSIPEMGILLDMLDMSMQTSRELKQSEARIKEHINTLLDTKLSTTALQEAYKAGQQKIISAATDLIIPDQTAQAKRNQQQTTPTLFTDGLCKGRQLHPATDRYFVSHGFDQQKLADWRQVLTDALARINHASQPLQPYFSGDTLLGGFRLCGICERLYSTNFSLFLLPATQDRNVYLELGIAIGLGQPFLLIQEHTAPIPPVLTSLSFYTQGGSLRSMRRELAGQVEEYDFGAVQFLKDINDVQVHPQYVIAAGEMFDDEDFEGAITDAIEKSYPQALITQSLSTHLKKMQGIGIQQLAELLLTSRFTIYRLDEQCSPTTFLALGMSIGLNLPFLMICKEGSSVPLDLRGLGIYQFPNFTDLEQDLAAWHHTFFSKYAV